MLNYLKLLPKILDALLAIKAGQDAALAELKAIHATEDLLLAEAQAIHKCLCEPQVADIAVDFGTPVDRIK